MADPYWPRPVVQPQPPAVPALTVAVAGKRLRSDLDPTADQPYVPQEANRGALQAIKDVASINASYERYLSATQMSSDTGALPMSARPPVRVSGHQFDHPQGISSLDYEGRRDEVPLPPDASSTLYVEGLPSNCTRREVAHIFRPFLGYREVRIVHKDPRHPGQDRVVLCFVDFVSPVHAAGALNALQGCNLLDTRVQDSAAGIAASLDYLRRKVDHGILEFVSDEFARDVCEANLAFAVGADPARSAFLGPLTSFDAVL